MGEEVRETPTAARWLAWATAVLLAFGVVSAGVVDVRDGHFDADIVSAAGGTARTVEVPYSSTTTVTSVPPVTSTSRPAVARSTTVPKAAAAVLAAIGSTAPPTTQPSPAVTPTTRAPMTPTTATTTTTTAPATTTTTVPGRAAVPLATEHPPAVLLHVTGRAFKLEPGEEVGPVDIALLPTGNDVLEAQAAADPACVRTDTADFFQSGGRYRLAIVTTEGACGSIPNLQLEVTPA